MKTFMTVGKQEKAPLEHVTTREKRGMGMM